MKKSVAADFVDKLVSLSPPTRRKNVPRVGNVPVSPTLRVHRRKRGEIMLPLNQRRRLLHGFFIQRIWIVPDVPGQKRRADGFSVNPVPISFCQSRLAGVEFSGNLYRLQHPDRSRKNVIEGSRKVRRGN